MARHEWSYAVGYSLLPENEERVQWLRRNWNFGQPEALETEEEEMLELS